MFLGPRWVSPGSPEFVLASLESFFDYCDHLGDGAWGLADWVQEAGSEAELSPVWAWGIGFEVLE